MDIETEAPRPSPANFWIRVAMLGVIALVALGNALEWVDPDLWIPFVCIIAVMGLGTRGGVLDTLGFVLVELAVVLVLGVATFSGSRDFVWAASVAISILAVGKIALLQFATSAPPASVAATRPEKTPSPKADARPSAKRETGTSADASD